MITPIDGVGDGARLGLMTDDNRKIRFDGREMGSISLKKLYRMRLRGDIGESTEFLSEITNVWLPLSGIMEDFKPNTQDKLKQMAEIGIRSVGILGTIEDCAACLALTIGVYPIDQVPMLPPEDCKCVPWCRLTVIANS